MLEGNEDNHKISLKFGKIRSGTALVAGKIHIDL